MTFDELVKSPNFTFYVIPAKTGHVVKHSANPVFSIDSGCRIKSGMTNDLSGTCRHSDEGRAPSEASALSRRVDKFL